MSVVCESWGFGDGMSSHHHVTPHCIPPEKEKERDSRLRSSAVLSDLVLHRGLLVAVRAVVVARQDIGVDVAEANPVVAVLLAARNAVLVAANTRIDNVLRIALVVGRGKGGRAQGEDGSEEGSGVHCNGMNRVQGG